MRKLILSFALVMTLLIPMPVYAETTLDDISDGTAEEQANDNDNAVSDYLNDYTPITNDNMAKASTLASPIANFLGNLAGFILIVVDGGLVVVTALDLAYIGLPFTRETLTSKKQLVSDEAIAVVPKPTPQGMPGQPPMMGGGMNPMMGGGMNPMNMPGASNQQQQSTKSVILTYFKKRTLFIILFIVASIVLTSSLLTHSGINIAELLLKLLGKGNTMISNVEVS